MRLDVKFMKFDYNLISIVNLCFFFLDRPTPSTMASSTASGGPTLSRSSSARRKRKEEDPTAHEIYLEKERQRSRARRAEKKKLREQTPVTRAVQQDYEKELQQAR